MGLLSPIWNFLFGKEPAIFDANGQIRHNLPEKTWENWRNKYRTNPENNWRNHAGTQPKKIKK